MRDSVTEDLKERERSLWEEWKRHRAKEYPDDAVITFIASSRSRMPSEGHIIGEATNIGYVRTRFHPIRTTGRCEIPEWKRMVRDIAIRDICSVEVSSGEAGKEREA